MSADYVSEIQKAPESFTLGFAFPSAGVGTAFEKASEAEFCADFVANKSFAEREREALAKDQHMREPFMDLGIFISRY